MKRINRALVLALGLLCLCAAFGCAAQTPKDTRPSVVVTIFPQYDFIRAIAGERVRLTMLVKPGSEVHGYDPTFSEVSEILNADLFVYAGGESDSWVQDVLDRSERGVKALTLIELVDALDEETVEGMQAEPEEEPNKDEHVWTSPQNAIRIVEGLCDTLCELLPDEAEAMQKNAEDYIEALNELDGEFHEIMRNAKRKTVVFADRFPFRYLCEELGLSYYAALPGCSSNEEVSLTTVAFLIERVQTEQLPGVFYIEFSDEKTADSIAAATGCQTWRMHSCHNVSRADFDSGVTYLDLMRSNAESLRKAVS